MTELFAKLNNPNNIITGYVFGIFVLYWGHRLFWEWSRNFSKMTTRFWGLFFLFSGIAAVAGATFRGLSDILPPETISLLRKTTLTSMVISTLFLLLTGIKSFFHPRIQRLSMFTGIVTFLVLSLRTWSNPEFELVIMSYMPVLVLVLLLNLKEYLKYRKTSHKFGAMGLGVELLATYGVTMHYGLFRYFDANDVYHLLSLIAYFLLYYGARYAIDHRGW
jgi:hypothetical protein